MAYIAPYIDAEGIHIPTYTDIRDHLIEGYREVFGSDLYLGEETMDYQMISVFARCLDDFAAVITDLYNSRSPNFATGDSLDLLLPLNGMIRNPATCSTATLTLTGTPGATIPAGSQAVDEEGYLWSTDEDCLLDEEGRGLIGATCDTPGAIAAPAGTIISIYSSVYDWMDVTNEYDAVVGEDVETDEEVRIRRADAVSTGLNGTYAAMVRALKDIEGTDSVDVLVNDTDETNPTTGQTPHSVCAVVHSSFEAGSTEETNYRSAVAETIWNTKAPGVGTYGNTTATYRNAQGTNYNIRFVVPVKKLVSVNVTLNILAEYDGERILPMIRSALSSDINALGVGKSWNVTMAYKDIYSAFTGETCPFVVANVTATKQGVAGFQTITVPCSYDEILYTDADHITFTIS